MRIWYADALRLLDACVKAGILHAEGDNIAVYREPARFDLETGKDEFPAGWYLEKRTDIAQELMNDEGGIALLSKELQKRGVAFNPQEVATMLSDVNILLSKGGSRSSHG